MPPEGSQAGTWKRLSDFVRSLFIHIPAIDPTYSRSIDLLTALPVSALAGGAALSFAMGPPKIVELPLWPVMATFVGLYVFPFALVTLVPTYYVLRRLNRLRLRQCLFVGGAVGLVVGALSYLPDIRILWIAVCVVTGVASAAAAYQSLALLSRRRSPNLPLQTDQSPAAEL